jgi:gliding motility-associated-like protein
LTLLSCYAICMKTALLKPFLLFLLCCSLFLNLSAQAQKEANNWYFGYGAGISFNSNPPSALYGGQTAFVYGAASMSGASGNLLFYAAPFSLRNRNHQLMPNSTGMSIGGNDDNTLIVPWPGQSQKYYLFTPSQTSGPVSTPYEGYSIIDMALNGGLGNVTATKNVYLTDYSFSDVNGVKHRNNRDYWVIHQMSAVNIFKVFLVSPAGLDTTPIVSTISQIPVNVPVGSIIKISPDGQTIAFSVHDATGNNSIYLLNFDAATGLATYRGTLPVPDAFALEFSPDGTRLYCNQYSQQGAHFYSHLIQFDLTAGTPATIFNSKTTIYQDSTINNYGLMQVGPNGKIYLTNAANQRHLSVINRPNLKGTACRFIPFSFDLNPLNTGQIRAGVTLPTFIQSYFYRPKITMQQTCFGDTAFFTLGNRAYADSVRWNFGDPTSGALNKSTSFSPKHFYASPGSYNVEAIVHFNFTSDTLHQTIFVPVTITKPNLGNDTTLCNGDTLILNAYQPGASYEWQDSLTSDSVFVVTRPGTYWVQVTNGCGTLSDSITVNFTSPLSLQLPKDTLLCPGQTLTITVNANGGNLLWSDATTNATLIVSKPGTYWAELSNACGVWRDSVTVSYRQPVSNKWLPRDTAFCNQSNYLINGTNPKALSYKWQDGSKNPNFTATASGVYWLEITTACATVRDSINVTFNQFPTKRFAPDTTICSGDNFVLKAPLGLSYRWNTGDSTRQISIGKAGKYKVTMELAKGCFFSDSMQVKEERCFRTAYIPNIITPNRDNLNDTFEPKGLEAGAWQLEIYSRWGILIYKNENYTSQWPDADINDGTYYYLLRNKQTGKTHKGWIEVAK